MIDELSMNSGKVWRIITENLRMRKSCAKMVPMLLNEGQKEQRVQVCQDILEELETKPNLLKRVVTCDESWIFKYNLLTKWQSLEWTQRGEGVQIQNQGDADRFFDVHGIVHVQFLPQGQTINQNNYKNILQCVMRLMRKKKELWVMRSWLLHHNNAPAHNALGIWEFLAKNNIALLEQPAYSTDLAPCDFFLFPKLKEVIKGTRFQDSKAIKTVVMKELLVIPEESFQECVEAWQRRLEKCI